MLARCLQSSHPRIHLLARHGGGALAAPSRRRALARPRALLMKHVLNVVVLYLLVPSQAARVHKTMHLNPQIDDGAIVTHQVSATRSQAELRPLPTGVELERRDYACK